jgi:hypothetical protein
MFPETVTAAARGQQKTRKLSPAGSPKSKSN